MKTSQTVKLVSQYYSQEEKRKKSLGSGSALLFPLGSHYPRNRPVNTGLFFTHFLLISQPTGI
jgi:hypothetical protein